jgi:ribokinase
MGEDAFADPIEASLRQAKVDLSIVRTPNLPTGTAFICVSDDAENAITVAPGANLSLGPSHLPDLAGVTHLLMQLEIPLSTVAAYSQAARQQGVAVVLNAAPVQNLPAELLALIDILVVNEGELASLSDTNANVAESLERIAVPTVVVTLGARGCCVRHHGQFLLQPGFDVTPVDTTAAGDSCCGSLVAALSTGADMPLALLRACAAGALACTRRGAQTSIPDAADVTEFLNRQPPADSVAISALQAYCGLPSLTTY